MTTDEPAGSGRLDVAVSIASHQSLDALCLCLSGLPSACAGLRWEVVVLQNVPCPEDQVIEERFPWVTVVRNAVPVGFGANHNTALAPVVAERRARYALVLNDDTELRPDAVTQLVGCADAEQRLGAVGPLTWYPDGTPQPVYYSFPNPARSFSAAVVPWIARARPIGSGRGWLRGSCMLFRVDALRQVGLFDPRFFLFFEDTDICARLWKWGWRVAVCETAAITHAAHTTLSRPELVRASERQLLRSQYLYHLKHHGRMTAGLVAQLNRMGLLGRAARKLLPPSAPRGERRSEVRHLAELAAYRPDRALPHESPPDVDDMAPAG